MISVFSMICHGKGEKSKMKFFIIFVVSVLVLFNEADPAGAWSYPGSGNMIAEVSNQALPGDPVGSVDARTLGMGGAGIAVSEGVTGLMYNPANIANQSRALMLGLNSNIVEETGGDEEFYSSAHYFRMPVWGMIYPVGPVNLGVGQRRDLDMDYFHEHKVFEDGVADTYKADISGGINRTMLTTGFRVFGNMYTGVTFNLLGGGVEGDSNQKIVGDSKTDHEIERDFSGNYIELGVLYRLFRDQAAIGLNFAPSYTIEDDWEQVTEKEIWDDTGDGVWVEDSKTKLKDKRDVDMPSKIGLGIRYNFLSLDQTLITAEIERVSWSDFRYQDSNGDKVNPGYRDTTSLRVGAEHYVNFTTALRAGFSYQPFYSSSAVDRVSFNLGTGIDVSPDISINIGGKMGMSTYQGDNPFSEEDKRVTERQIELMTGMVWNF